MKLNITSLKIEMVKKRMNQNKLAELSGVNKRQGKKKRQNGRQKEKNRWKN